MNKKLILIIVLAILLSAIYYTWTYFSKSINGNKIVASGTIEAIEVDVASKIAGRIQEIYADEGDSVKKGQIIARIDAPEIASQLKGAKAIKNIASSKSFNAKNDFERAKELYKNNLISDQQYDAQKLVYESSEDNLIQAESQFEIAKNLFDNTFIKSPINGIVLVKAVEEGELVSPQAVIFSVSDLKMVELKLYVAEKEVGRINLGDEAQISVDSYPGSKFLGQVKYISNKAEFTPKNIQTKEERQNLMFEVKVKIPNPDLKLKPGIPADAQIMLNN